MSYLFSAFMMVFDGWHRFHRAKNDGTWSNKSFFVIVAGAVLLCGAIILPIMLIPMSVLQAHPAIFFSSWFIVLAIGLTGLIRYSIKSNKAHDTKIARPKPKTF